MEAVKVWAVIMNEDNIDENLFQRALTILDSESQAKIKRFYHRVDSCRTLYGRLLVRAMLKQQGVPVSQMKFASTQNGKPYLVRITTQIVEPPIAYNITHDNNVVAMAYGPGSANPPAFSLGIDVMKIRIPGRETINEFIEVVGDQLSQEEHTLLEAAPTDDERIKSFFWMWTLKEAYTKALGMGLGFDFKRVEFDPRRMSVKVDGSIPTGWTFRMFALKQGEDEYQGVVANFTENKSPAVVLLETFQGDDSWLKVEEAGPFAIEAISILRE